MYTGKDEESADTTTSGYGATYDLVMRMLRPFYFTGHHCYMDNYYSSPKLYADLHSLGVGATGTLRPNRRGVPEAVKLANPPKGQSVVYHKDQLVLMKFHDRKIVHLLSTVLKTYEVLTGEGCSI